MNEELARLYGTGAVVESQDVDALEKMAQLSLLSKEAEEQGIDLTQLTPEEQDYVIAQMTQPMEKDAGLNDAQAKIEEADYIGRVMAHAFWQEKIAIEKAASPQSGGESIGPMQAAAFQRKVKAEREAKNQVAQAADDAAKYDGPAAAGSGASGGKSVSALENQAMNMSEKLRGVKSKVVDLAKKNPRAAAAIGGAALLGTGVAAGAAVRGSKKTGSAWDELVQKRAYDMLAASGWVDQNGAVIEPNQKVASEIDQVNAMADETALSLLAQLGYPVQQ